MARVWLAAVCLLASTISACGGGGGGGGGGAPSTAPGTPPPVPVGPSPPAPAPTPTPSPASSLMDPSKWEIGPIINGTNYSVGMPLRPSLHPDGWSIDLPQPTSEVGHAHYITTQSDSLAGKTRIVLKYKIEAEAGVRILPRTNPDLPSLLTLYFQRAGDNWTGSGDYETYRWWATFRTHVDLKPGEYEMVVRFDEIWTAVQSSTAATRPSAFQTAMQYASRVGFTLGGGDGYGHGVFATGPARIIVTDFRIE